MSQTMKPRVNPSKLLPGEHDIETEAAQIFADPDAWLSQEHPLLGGRSPRQCIAGGDEQAVRDLLRSIVHVGQT
jgi:hypothetical protein